MSIRRTSSVAGALLLVVAVSGPVVAAPKDGCPGDSSRWAPSTVAAATDVIWPALLDPGAIGTKDDLLALIDGSDRNDDDAVCLLTMWGDALNPNSHWYQVGLEILGSPTQQFFVHDNNANASS